MGEKLLIGLFIDIFYNVHYGMFIFQVFMKFDIYSILVMIKLFKVVLTKLCQ